MLYTNIVSLSNELLVYYSKRHKYLDLLIEYNCLKNNIYNIQLLDPSIFSQYLTSAIHKYKKANTPETKKN